MLMRWRRSLPVAPQQCQHLSTEMTGCETGRRPCKRSASAVASDEIRAWAEQTGRRVLGSWTLKSLTTSVATGR